MAAQRFRGPVSSLIPGPGTTRGRGSVPGMAAQRFRGPVLPDGEARDLYVVDGPSGPAGEARDLYVVDGLVTYEAQAGAETVAEGWIVPGLVDAHCHVGLDENGAVDDETSRAAGDHRPRLGCAAAARLRLGGRHLLDPRPRGPAAAGPGRSAHRAHQALHPQLRPRGRAGRARRRTSPRRRSAATAGSSWSATGSTATPATSSRPSRPTRSPRPSRPPTSTAPRSPPTASARRCCRG